MGYSVKMKNLLIYVIFSLGVLISMTILMSWAAYFILGGIVAGVLFLKREKKSRPIYFTPLAFIMDTILWPAMVTSNINRAYHEATAN